MTKVIFLIVSAHKKNNCFGFILCQTKSTMSVIFILISISLVVAVCFLGAFLWAIKTGQYDDNQTPAIRMLFEDKAKKVNEQ